MFVVQIHMRDCVWLGKSGFIIELLCFETQGRQD